MQTLGHTRTTSAQRWPVLPTVGVVLAVVAALFLLGVFVGSIR